MAQGGSYTCKLRRPGLPEPAAESRTGTTTRHGGADSNLRRQSQRVYSASPLTAREPRLGRRTVYRQEASRSCWASGSVCSFFSVRFSIWRTRSRVMLNARPTSSSVRDAAADDAVAHLDHLALAAGQRRQHAHDVLATQRLRGDLERRRRRDVLDEVRQRRIVLLAHRLLQRDGCWVMRITSRTSRTEHSSSSASSSALGSRPSCWIRLPFGVHQLVQPLDHVHRDPDRASLVGKRAA